MKCLECPVQLPGSRQLIRIYWTKNKFLYYESPTSWSPFARHISVGISETDMMENSSFLEAFGNFDFLETIIFMLLDAAGEDEFHVRIRVSCEVFDEPAREHVGRSETRVLAVVGNDEIFRGQMEMCEGLGALFGWPVIGEVDSRIDAADMIQADIMKALLRVIGIDDDMVSEKQLPPLLRSVEGFA